MTESPIARVVLDPHLELADTDLSDNEFPPKPTESRFKLFKRKDSKNPMQKARDEEERAREEAAETAVEAGAPSGDAGGVQDADE